jgi:hypothetical protein
MEIIYRIRVTAQEFIRTTGQLPQNLYLGEGELRLLNESPHYKPDPGQQIILGYKIFEVCTKNHLSVS